MATVDRPRTYRDDLDDGPFLDPFAVADCGHSEPASAEAECMAQSCSRSHPEMQNRQATRPGRRLHRTAIVRQRQGVTLRNVARRLGIELSIAAVNTIGTKRRRTYAHDVAYCWQCAAGY